MNNRDRKKTIIILYIYITVLILVLNRSIVEEQVNAEGSPKSKGNAQYFELNLLCKISSSCSYEYFFLIAKKLKDKFQKKFKRKHIVVWATKPYKPAIVVEEYKIMWHLIAKNAASSARELLYRMSKDGEVEVDKKVRYMELWTLKNTTHYSPEKVEEFKNSPNWTRTAILRDPKDRLLSAYLDKEKASHRTDMKIPSEFKEWCCFRVPRVASSKVMTKDECFKHKFSFSEFIEIAKSCPNTHWYPQHKQVQNWDYIDFPINFNDIANDTERMFKNVVNNAWNKFGKTFQNNSRHASDSGSKFRKFYTPKLEKIVEEMYRDDYILLKKLFPNDEKYSRIEL